jgi:small-conductance mechanosensitive channel
MRAVLGQTFLDGLRDGFRDVGQTVADYTPKLVGALLILLIGWFVARVIRNVLGRILDGIGLDKLLDRAGIGETVRNAGYTASGVLTSIIYYLLMAVVLLLAAEALGVNELTTLLRDLIAYLPRLLIAVVIVVIAAAIGNFTANLVRPLVTSQNLAWVAVAARVIILGFGIVAAFETLDLAPVLVTTVVTSFFGALGVAVGVALAIAFGVGGIETARKWWEKFAPKAD